jgi:hypothetical protein
MPTFGTGRHPFFGTSHHPFGLSLSKPWFDARWPFDKLRANGWEA